MNILVISLAVSIPVIVTFFIIWIANFIYRCNRRKRFGNHNHQDEQLINVKPVVPSAPPQQQLPLDDQQLIVQRTADQRHHVTVVDEHPQLPHVNFDAAGGAFVYFPPDYAARLRTDSTAISIIGSEPPPPYDDDDVTEDLSSPV